MERRHQSSGWLAVLTVTAYRINGKSTQQGDSYVMPMLAEKGPSSVGTMICYEGCD